MAIRYIGLIPAAGTGSRMGGDAPKQYLRLGSRTLLEHSAAALLSDPRIERVLIVVAPHDRHAAHLALPDRAVLAAVGGASRAESVRNGLQALAQQAREHDRVLVHDAARPCLSRPDLAALIDRVGPEEAGGLLAAPLADTLKRVEQGRVVATVDRSVLWTAQTPQLFPFGILLRALQQCGDLGTVTDEASAVEALGLQPQVVAASDPNPKVTTPADWPLAEAVLKASGRW